MATEKQIAVNRRNARKSTGPRTPEGKRRSSMNALRHGCTARSMIIPGETKEEYDEFCKVIWQSHGPRDGYEEVLVTQLANIAWQIRRLDHGVSMLHWYQFNTADIDFQKRRKIPAPPQTEEEWEQYRHGRATQSLSDSDKNCYNSLARYRNTLQRAQTQVKSDLAAHRKFKRMAAEDEIVDAEVEVIDSRPLPKLPAQEPGPVARILRNEPLSDANSLDSTG